MLCEVEKCSLAARLSINLVAMAKGLDLVGGEWTAKGRRS